MAEFLKVTPSGTIIVRAAFACFGEFPDTVWETHVRRDDSIWVKVPVDCGLERIDPPIFNGVSVRVANRIRSEARQAAWNAGVRLPWIVVSAASSRWGARVSVALIYSPLPPCRILNAPGQRIHARADKVNVGSTSECGLARVLSEFQREWPDAIVIARSPKVRVMVTKCITANLEREPHGSEHSL